MSPVVRSVVRKVVPEPIRRKIRPWEPPVFDEVCGLPGSIINRVDGKLPDFCTPLDDPRWVTLDEAPTMRDDDAVLAFVHREQAYGIPWWVIKNHHVANIELAGEPLVVTLCEACAGGGVYDPIVDGQHLWFRMEGVYNGTPMLVDEPTGTLWTMVTMTPLLGPGLEHGPLRRRPIVHLTWAEFRALHADGMVAYDEDEPRGGHGVTHLRPDHPDGTPFAALRLVPDDPRLDQASLVVGVRTPTGGNRSYPLRLLHAAGGLLDDLVAGDPVLIASPPGSWTAVVFDRRVDGRVLSFSWCADPPPVQPTGTGPWLTDAETRSVWDLWGRAVAGPMSGAHLTSLRGGLNKWFGWTNTSPGGEVWGIDPHLPLPPGTRVPRVRRRHRGR